MMSRLVGGRRCMKVHDLPFVAETLQDEGAPLARRFATQLKCDDSVAIELLNQPVLWSNGGWRAIRSRRAPRNTERTQRNHDYRTL